MKEYSYIKYVADVNGYEDEMVDRSIQKHTKKVHKSELSTLFSQSKSSTEANSVRTSMSFIPKITNKLKTIFAQHKMDMVFKRENKLRQLLGTAKEKSDENLKSGIYEVNCPDCDEKYYGQTTRNLPVRFKEHMRHTKFNRPHLSAVAKHILSNEHWSISVDTASAVNDNKRLDAYESYYIRRQPNVMNTDNGNIDSVLFQTV